MTHPSILDERGINDERTNMRINKNLYTAMTQPGVEPSVFCQRDCESLIGSRCTPSATGSYFPAFGPLVSVSKNSARVAGGKKKKFSAPLI
jgi:hypothetical protein